MSNTLDFRDRETINIKFLDEVRPTLEQIAELMETISDFYFEERKVRLTIDSLGIKKIAIEMSRVDIKSDYKKIIDHFLRSGKFLKYNEEQEQEQDEDMAGVR